MFSLIAIFGPCIIGLKLLDYLKKGLSIKNSIYYYLVLLVLSSACTSIIVYYLFGTKNKLFELLNNSVLYFGEYTLINVLVNIILVLIIYIFIKNVSFKVVVEEVKNERKTKTSKKHFNKIKKVFSKKQEKNS